MSKTINIITDRTTHQATGDKIRTTLMEGGSQDWIPQEEYKNLINKENITIDENGTYLPSDYNCDAIGTVTVKLGDGEGEDDTNIYKGPGTVTGIDPETGEPTSVSTNPTTGDIQKNEIPFFLSVVIPPTKTTYTEGETIDFTGLKCGAYKASGTAFELDNYEAYSDYHNIVPFDELTFPVTIATAGDSE